MYIKSIFCESNQINVRQIIVIVEVAKVILILQVKKWY